MKTRTDWTDLAYFAALARTGTLGRAAEETGVSPATLSRRMRALETALGRRLFLHGADGYAPSAAGRELARRVRGMEQAARGVESWRDAGDGPVRVRISAGHWTALDLAENLPDYWREDALWMPEFIYSDLDLDIARRQVDLGIRNRRPDLPWAARRRIGSVAYAVYGAHDGVTGWIGPAQGAPTPPSLRWVLDHHADAIATRANSPHLAAALARAGIGRIVLPTFVGARMDGLIRLSDPIAELQSEQWLLSHQDARADPPIRAALDAIAGYLARRDV